MTPLPHNAVLLSFEGPDPYSMVGGLGTRVTELSGALAEAGVSSTLLFVGDPSREPAEQPAANLEYRRWCQWISKYYPGGVYDGEVAKMNDFTASVPPFVTQTIVEPAAARGESVLIFAEDWQTAATAIALDAVLRERGLRDRAILTWNANNTYGFDTIDWGALARAAQITSVSRYMKFELQLRGVESLVIPNGIPERLLAGAPKTLVQFAEELWERRRPLYVKVARFEEDKRWMQAVEAFAVIADERPGATLVVRGGREAYGEAVFARARALGLDVRDLTLTAREPNDVVAAIAAAPGAVLNVQSFVPEDALLALYRVADGVLANSGREPFGLVGLEVMAAGGIAITGSTGEDYVQPFGNAIVCDTGDPRELATYLTELIADPKLAATIRDGGTATAKRYIWPRVL
ncbi:MAG TPA: glycosyltransferase family 4 protein, partial [Candidatus Cybelea sp.]|nr:glycosyltransferase family 4 protein [Candidatus Cybelea sp.]